MRSRCFFTMPLTVLLRIMALALLGGLACRHLPIASAQGTKADYERADKLYELTRNKVLRGKLDPHWSADGQTFWYERETSPDQRDYVRVLLATGEKQPLLDQASLAAKLGEKLGSEVLPQKLLLHHLEELEAGAAFRFQVGGKSWRWTAVTSELTETEGYKPASRVTFQPAVQHPAQESPRSEDSPDGQWTTFVKDHNLLLKSKASGEEFPLSTDGKADNYFERGVFWAPDSSRLVALQTEPPEQHRVPLIESSPPDRVQPKLHFIDYLKPGDKIPQSRPRLFDVTQRKRLNLSDELYSNPWSIDQFRWSADSQRFTFLYNQRGHQVLRIVVLSGETGEAGALLEEKSKTFIDYAGKQFGFYNENLAGHTPTISGEADPHEIIWMSERDGWNHLYLFDARTGHLKNQITRGNWVVREVTLVDPQQRQIWFRAAGLFPEQDPYYQHFCRVNFDGSGLTILTSGNGTHEIERSPDGRYFLDTYSRIDQPPVMELRQTDLGLRVAEIDRADASALLATGWKMPERFTAKARDGETNIYGVIYTPTNLDLGKKYPVIEQIYAGPHGAHVPKRFSSYHPPQALAELGFVVVQIDGMGTSNRSKAFHDVCWQNLGDSGFPDRIAWLKKGAEAHPYFDLSRVGIYGGSAGGQSSTRALLAYGDFYKVAVSDCGCHDNRMDKVWWNELWMGWPIGPHYVEQSNVTQAHRLQGKLMLTVGELDKNVDPTSTMQVVNALIKANKDFDLVVFPGGGHGVGDSPYGQRRRRDFFVRHLHGIEPRRE